MRLVYINKTLRRSNGVFWIKAFQKQATKFFHINSPNWTVNQLIKLNPDHIHFNSAAQPVPTWMPIHKIEELRYKLKKTVITHYYCDALKAQSHRAEMNRKLDAVFSSYDNMTDTIWMPVPSNVQFWNIPRPKTAKYNIIFVGNVYEKHLAGYKIKYTRQRTLKAVMNHFKVTIVGNKWKRYYNIDHLPATKNYNETRRYYTNSLVGLNISNDGLRNLGKCWSSRLTHMMLAGLPCFTARMPRLDQVFEHGKHLIMYNDDNDLLTQLDFYMKRRKLLDEIGKQGQIRMRELADIDLAVMRILEVRRK